MRYLDSMEEEQRRGITIRSSAIGLKHRRRHQHQHQHPIKNTKKNTTDTNTNTNSKNNNNSISKNASNDNDMVIHLIDSPGHVDFSMEVSSALQICDGAILVVDVVEGMCARTQSILREAHSQRLVPILVLNKIDRLCSDLGLTVNESYLRIRNVVENVNAAASAMISSANAQKKDGDGDGDGEDSNIDTIDGAEDASEDDDDEQDLEEIWNFDPVLGNVVFTTALYGTYVCLFVRLFCCLICIIKFIHVLCLYICMQRTISDPIIHILCNTASYANQSITHDSSRMGIHHTIARTSTLQIQNRTQRQTPHYETVPLWRFQIPHRQWKNHQMETKIKIKR